MFHADVQRPWTIAVHFLVHGVHHLTLKDRTRLVAPPLLIAFIGLPVFAALYAVLPHAALAQAAFAGLVAGYLVYDLMHYALHHPPSMLAHARWFKRLRLHHLAHHYAQHDRRFGVSNDWTDRLFGTRAAPAESATGAK